MMSEVFESRINPCALLVNESGNQSLIEHARNDDDQAVGRVDGQVYMPRA